MISNSYSNYMPEYNNVDNVFQIGSANLRDIYSMTSTKCLIQDDWSSVALVFSRVSKQDCLALVRTVFPNYNNIHASYNEMAELWLTHILKSNPMVTMQTLSLEFAKLDSEIGVRTVFLFFPNSEVGALFASEPLRALNIPRIEHEYSYLIEIFNGDEFRKYEESRAVFAGLLGFPSNIQAELSPENLVNMIRYSNDNCDSGEEISWGEIKSFLELMKFQESIDSIWKLEESVKSQILKQRGNPARHDDQNHFANTPGESIPVDGSLSLDEGLESQYSKEIEHSNNTEVTPSCSHIKTWKIYVWLKRSCCISSSTTDSVAVDEQPVNPEQPVNLELRWHYLKLKEYKLLDFRTVVNCLSVSDKKNFLLKLSAKSRLNYGRSLKNPDFNCKINNEYLNRVFANDKIITWDRIIKHKDNRCTWLDAIEVLNEMGKTQEALELINVLNK